MKFKNFCAIKPLRRIFKFVTIADNLLVCQCSIVIYSWSHSDTSHLVGLLWTNDQPEIETSLPDNEQHFYKRNFHALCGIRSKNPRKRAAKAQSLGRCQLGSNIYGNMKTNCRFERQLCLLISDLKSIMKSAEDIQIVALMGTRWCAVCTSRNHRQSQRCLDMGHFPHQ